MDGGGKSQMFSWKTTGTPPQFVRILSGIGELALSKASEDRPLQKRNRRPFRRVNFNLVRI
jgi:hypothetical protein